MAVPCNGLMAISGFEIIGTSKKGRALYAAKPIKEGEVLFEESPLVSCQFAWNEDYGYLACHYCLRALESAEENVRRLCQDGLISLPCPELSAARPELYSSCECGARYCSRDCQELAYSKFHASLCAPPGQEKGNVLQNLRDVWKNMQYPPESATIMLILRIYAIVHQAENKENAIKMFEDFILDTSNPSGSICQKLLGSQFNDNISVLGDAVDQCVQVLGLNIPSKWQTPGELMSKLVVIATNNQGIGTSAFSQWVSNVENSSSLSSDERTRLDGVITEIYNKMEEVVGLEFLNNEGSGLYSVQSKINHSCDPNVEITFPNGNHTLVVRALRDIAHGDEICSSYIDECALARSRHSRQKILRENYFFKCLCAKCEEQAADPDETSEEEEDDEMSS